MMKNIYSVSTIKSILVWKLIINNYRETKTNRINKRSKGTNGLCKITASSTTATNSK